MKIKAKENHYAKKKAVIVGKCDKCKSTVLFEKMYVAHNGPYIWNFCTDCVHSLEEAKEASVIKRPSFSPVSKA